MSPLHVPQPEGYGSGRIRRFRFVGKWVLVAEGREVEVREAGAGAWDVFTAYGLVAAGLSLPGALEWAEAALAPPPGPPGLRLLPDAG